MSTTLLIVDDSRIARMMLRAFALERRPDLLIVEAASADEALIQAAQHPEIDLISIDYNMPGRDGIELAQALLPILPNASKALLTANIQDSIRAKAEAMGLFFITKPITQSSTDALLALLQKAPDEAA